MWTPPRSGLSSGSSWQWRIDKMGSRLQHHQHYGRARYGCLTVHCSPRPSGDGILPPVVSDQDNPASAWQQVRVSSGHPWIRTPRIRCLEDRAIAERPCVACRSCPNLNGPPEQCCRQYDRTNLDVDVGLDIDQSPQRRGLNMHRARRKGQPAKILHRERRKTSITSRLPRAKARLTHVPPLTRARNCDADRPPVHPEHQIGRIRGRRAQSECLRAEPVHGRRQVGPIGCTGRNR